MPLKDLVSTDRARVNATPVIASGQSIGLRLARITVAPRNSEMAAAAAARVVQGDAAASCRERGGRATCPTRGNAAFAVVSACNVS